MSGLEEIRKARGKILATIQEARDMEHGTIGELAAQYQSVEAMQRLLKFFNERATIMTYVVIDLTGGEKGNVGGIPILVTDDVVLAGVYAEICSTPGVLSDSHAGGLHAIIHMQSDKVYAPSEATWQYFNNGKEIVS
jgi:hypothetical protein